jgi:MFS family permease
MLVSWQLTAAIVVIVLLTPTLVQTSFGIAPAVAFQGNSLATLALVFGCLVAGCAVDRIGVGRALLFGSLGLGAAAYALYGALVAGHQAQFVAWYTLAGFCCGVVGVTPALMVAAFPPEVRFSGLSFSYNVAYAVFGGLTPPLIAWLSVAWGPLAPAHYVSFTCLVGVGVAAWVIVKRPLRY